MELNAFGIVIAFIIMVAVMLWFIIGGRGYWFVKLLAAGFMLYFSLSMWASLSSLLGWPCNQNLPEKFLVHWVVVLEESKIADTKGAIYLMASELNDNYLPKQYKNSSSKLLSFVPKKDVGEPRLYKMPYSKEAHKQMTGILQKLKAGQPVVGESGKGGEKGEGEGKGKGKGKGKGLKGLEPGEDEGPGGMRAVYHTEQELMFYDLPAPTVLPKDYE